VVTSLILRSDPSALSSGGDRRGRICVYVRRGKYIHVYVNICVRTVFFQKKKTTESVVCFCMLTARQP
jgi:hypothetical protein